MEWIASVVDFVLHLDAHLAELIRQYGPWTYGILFAIVFCETGLVITPFLPGDTLLFAAGIFAHPEKGALNVWILFLVFVGGAFCGDNLNYFIGKTFGAKLFRNEKSRIFKRSYLDKTHAFFERHGGKTIILARFVPIVRTFTPFVAGMGSMTYVHFLAYSVIGAVIWVTVCMFAGFFFGKIPVVRDNFALAILGLVIVTLLPMAFEVWRHRRNSRRAVAASHASPEASD